MLTEDFLEQQSLSCAFQEEEGFGKWGKGRQSTEAGMGRGSGEMLGKSRHFPRSHGMSGQVGLEEALSAELSNWRRKEGGG